MADEPLDVTVVAAEFPSAKVALSAFEDLDRWINGGGRDASAYRLAGADGTPRIVVAVVLTHLGHAGPIASRLRRRGGTLSDIPEPDKRVLVERTLEAGAQGITARRAYKIALPLSGIDADPDLN